VSNLALACLVIACMVAQPFVLIGFLVLWDAEIARQVALINELEP
jgi:hypothetical protein